MDHKVKHSSLTVIFLGALIIGLVIIAFSNGLGELVSRNYFNDGINSGFTTDPATVMLKTIIFLVLGSVISLISGAGVIVSLFKK